MGNQVEFRVLRHLSLPGDDIADAAYHDVVRRYKTAGSAQGRLRVADETTFTVVPGAESIGVRQRLREIRVEFRARGSKWRSHWIPVAHTFQRQYRAGIAGGTGPRV